MSIESVAIALHHSKARGTAKLVLIGIANHDGDGGAWPSVETLAKYANVDVRSVQRALRELEALGEVRTVQRQGGTARTPGNYRPNLYEFLVTCPAECDRTKNHRTNRGDTDVTPRGDAGAAPEVTPASPEPSSEPPVEPSDGSKDRGSSSDDPWDSHPAPQRKRRGRRGTPPAGVSDNDQADFQALVTTCKEIGEDDPVSVWWTLRKEHRAWEPSRFLRDQVANGTWDGFVGRHGIGEYNPNGTAA